MIDNLRGAVAEVAMHFLSDRELAWLTQDQSLALADAVIREMPELQQQPVSMSDYAAHLCQSGCDCSCCYGMDDCYHVTDPCNCGMAAKEHRHD